MNNFFHWLWLQLPVHGPIGRDTTEREREILRQGPFTK